MSRQERRENARTPLSVVVKLSVGNEKLESQARDISIGGVSVIVKDELALGSPCDIELTDPFNSDIKFRVSGRCVWCTPMDQAFQIGVNFLPLLPEQLANLTRFVQFFANQRGA